LEPIFAGKPDKHIADELDLSIHTIRSYLKPIFNRVGVDGSRPLLGRRPFYDEFPFI
jgi:DNA-binding NarL/FixJ family response regulator